MTFERKTFLLVILFSFVIFFAQTRSFLLLADGLTYVALAKNILKTGDWSILHYGREQYPNFYQHPPLAIWMQAIVYKLFGYSEPLSRVLPALFAMGTVALVYWFTRIRFGIVAAFTAGIALVTSTRFIKWGTNFYLDGFLAFFCFSSFVLWVLALSSNDEVFSLKKKRWFSFLAGLFLSFAFMTKGMIAFSTLVLSVVVVLFYLSPVNFFLLGLFSLGLALPVLAWVQFAGGSNFIHQYMQLSFAGRVQTNAFNTGPWVNLLKVWWPWWPVFILGFIYALKRVLRSEPTAILIGLLALSFPVGFSLGIGYLEHYMTPFYPFACVLVGVQLSLWIKFLSERAVNIGYALVLGLAVFLATISPNVNAQKETMPNQWLREVRSLPLEKQNQIQQIAFTVASFDLWNSIAVILARSDWQAIGHFALDRAPLAHTVLVARSEEKVHHKWQPLNCLYVSGYQFYAPHGENLCK